MTSLPIKRKNRATANRRVGIKSSITHPLALLASVLILWKATRQPEVAYSGDDSGQSLELANELRKQISILWGSETQEIFSLLHASPLFNAQIEHLQVALGLVWKIANIKFSDETLSESAERTGGLRFPKVIKFTHYIDILENLTPETERGLNDETKNMLKAWLKNNKLQNSLETRILATLSALTEDTLLKTKTDNSEDYEFLQEGIYEKILTTKRGVSFNAELTGPLRILKKIIATDLHPYLKEYEGTLINRTGYQELADYTKRVGCFLDITTTSVLDYADQSVDSTTVGNAGGTEYFPRNWIVYGAPGTGKSHLLNESALKLSSTQIKRVTFYSDYYYQQFIGSYKPTVIYDSTTDGKFLGPDESKISRPGHPIIEYRFQPGPLLETVVCAIRDPGNNYVLIIEELNRADASSVFGEAFQLLDRDATGNSSYKVHLSSDAETYLRSNQILDGLYFPSNFYIWATVNNADQGVKLLDTAFKRRWEYSYLPIDHKEELCPTIKVILGNKNPETMITPSWNQLRRAINKKLASLSIPEDARIGPFFFNQQELSKQDFFWGKLLSYLRDDILRHRSEEFFAYPDLALGELLEKIKQGENIFAFEI